jgi:VanZ family protein
LRKRRIWIFVFWGFACIWTALLLVPDVASILFMPPEIPEGIAQSELPVDKIVHASGYFLLTALAIAAFGARDRGISLGWFFAGAALHGVATEVIQTFVPPREGDVLDWFADLTGTALAIATTLVLRRLARRTATANVGREPHG